MAHGPAPSCRLCQQTIYCALDDERHPERRYQRPHAVLLDSDLACLDHDASPRRYDGPGRLRAEGIDSETSERRWHAHMGIALARAGEEDSDS